MTHSHKKLNIVYVFFSDIFVLNSCSCHVLLAEFRTSANLTGFRVFALMHLFAQIFYFRTGNDAFSQRIKIFSDSFVIYSCSCHVLLAEAPRRIWQCVKWLKWGWLAYMIPTVCEIYTFAVLCSVIRPFLSLHFMLCNKEEFQTELRSCLVEFVSWQVIGLCSFCCYLHACVVEFDSSVSCHVSKYC